MEVRAVAKYIKVQPRKVRLVAREIKGKPAHYSAALLRFHPSKSAQILRKVLLSAVANAVENHGLSEENLRIQSISVDEGPRMKRIRARAMGRAYRILKKTSHIQVIVEDYEPNEKVKPHGTKSKVRPSFAKLSRKDRVKKSSQQEKTEEVVVEAALEESKVDGQRELDVQAELAHESSSEIIENSEEIQH